jgi:60 kDa SS-A/Ro ribonucleoprotein
MANLQLFNSLIPQLPAADTLNAEAAPAYELPPRHKLAQLAMTGCLNQTFYADAEAQLAQVLELTRDLEPEYIARTAIYCREKGHMKDMPALLLAVLAARRADVLGAAFGRVVDSGKMLRNFVQILRSGAAGRKSLGSRPKKLVQAWLNSASEAQLLSASIGQRPTLADVVKMVHPKPQEAWRAAFFAWLIGKPFDAAALPPATQALLRFRAAGGALPEVPFLLLSNESLDTAQWAELAGRMSWQALRMNLNTLARNGVFGVEGMAEKIAARLADASLIAKARAYPYQLLVAYRMADEAVPSVVRNALQDALEASLGNVPQLAGQVVVCPDVSGSMSSPLTGHRKGASSSVRCIDVAALMAAAVLRKHPTARVLPFENTVVRVELNLRDSVMSNAAKLAAVGGGGTNCSAPLAQLVSERAKVDVLVMVSDNQSWIDARSHGATETMRQWALLKRRNPRARLVCIDLQPYGNTQAQERSDVLNVGGFGDVVFDVMAQFASGQFGSGHWVEAIESVNL